LVLAHPLRRRLATPEQRLLASSALRDKMSVAGACRAQTRALAVGWVEA